MLAAVAEDFARLPGVEVQTILARDIASRPAIDGEVHLVSTSEERDDAIERWVNASDATILIAPEFAGTLLTLAERVVKLGGRLLSPSPEFIEIASDKHETAIRLHAAGARVPRGVVVMPGEMSPAGFDYPAILKPIDGAGSLGVQKLLGPSRVPSDSGAYRLEEFVPGTPASVACLCGGREIVVLEPCEQLIAADGSFAYQGGRLPLGPGERERAKKLGEAAVRALPPTVGYVGVDLVLGDDAGGGGDAVIEINPRYTTSYVGLLAATDTNLAELVWRLSNGDGVPPPTFDRSAAWDASGEVRLA